MRRSLEFVRRCALDWLFFSHWRLPDGWLSPMMAEGALQIFHDPLATAVRRALTTRRYPHLPLLAEG